MLLYFFYVILFNISKWNVLLYFSNYDWILFLDGKIIVVLLNLN